MQHAEPLAREAPSASSLDDPADPPSPGRASGEPHQSESFLDLADDERRLSRAARKWLCERTEAAMALIARETPAGTDASHDVRLRLVGDEEMARAHEAHKGVSGTTDVLTFDLRDDESAPLDVDVLLCVDEAARQAGERGIPVERELLLYAVHALLHCAGYDDHDETEASRMHAREDEILTAIGVGPTYDPARSGGGGS